MANPAPTNQQSNGAAHYMVAGATLLSQQPADPVERKVPDGKVKDWGVLKQHLESRLVGLRTWRQSWWTQNYSDLAQYIEPRRSIWLTQSSGGIPSPNNMTRGRPINSAILDPTGTYAVRVCSSGMMSGLASPSRPWFKITPSQPNAAIDAAGRQWMDDVEDRIYTFLAGSNFYNSFAQECEDLVVFGSAPVIIYEDAKDGLRCYNPCVGEYYLASGGTMRPDALYRAFVMTVEQIVDFFGVENCSAEIQKIWKQKGGAIDKEFIIAHSIEPNFGIKGTDTGKVKGNFAWREVYWLFGINTQQPLSMRGFIEQPFTAGRWSTQSNDAYGRSVGMDVLPDVIQLQVMTARLAEALEKMVRPPLVADMQLKNQPSSILPGHITYVQGLGTGTGIRSIYDTNPDVGGMEKLLLAIQERVKKGFFNDVILMLSSNPGDRRTAYETAALIQERLQVLGPVIENIITESLKPKLKRIYAILKRRGMLPPPPDSMKNIPIDVDFISMLALAQKASATGGIERLAAFIGNLVAVYPEAKDNLNIDRTIAHMNELLDNPQNLLNSEEEKAKIREMLAKKQQAMEAGAHAQQAADTVNTGAQAAQTLSQTEIGGGQTAMQGIFGNAQPGR